MNPYQFGQLCALQKIGMEAGAVNYTPTESRDNSFADNKKQLLWKQVDNEPFVTGEESSLGMPSPGKTASENDYAYGANEGPYAQGGFDANQDLPDRSKRIADALEAAFESNRLYDQSYAPEAAITNPHGPKLGFSMPRAPSIKPPSAGLMPRMGGKATSGMTQNPMGIKPPTIPKNVGVEQNWASRTVGQTPQNIASGSSIGRMPPAAQAQQSHLGKQVPNAIT